MGPITQLGSSEQMYDLRPTPLNKSKIIVGDSAVLEVSAVGSLNLRFTWATTLEPQETRLIFVGS
ncbi:unnamed protein product [Pylaiella littoralis]